jgi:hypothetical protein
MVFNIVQADIVGEDDDGEAARPAAADMPRPPRVTEPKSAYRQGDFRRADMAAKGEHSDGEWRAWLDKLRDACATLYHRSEVVQVAERPSVADALATGPEWVRDEVSAILAENYKRLPQRSPGGDLPDIEIKGKANTPGD